MAYVNPSHRFLGWSLTLFPVGYARNNSTGKHLRAFLIRCETTWTASCKCSGVWTLAPLSPYLVPKHNEIQSRFSLFLWEITAHGGGVDWHLYCNQTIHESSRRPHTSYFHSYTRLNRVKRKHLQRSMCHKFSAWSKLYTAWVCKETHITSRFKPMLTYCKTSFRYPCDYRERLLSYILHKAVHKNIWWHINSSECSDIFEIVSIWC